MMIFHALYTVDYRSESCHHIVTLHYNAIVGVCVTMDYLS